MDEYKAGKEWIAYFERWASSEVWAWIVEVNRMIDQRYNEEHWTIEQACAAACEMRSLVVGACEE